MEFRGVANQVWMMLAMTTRVMVGVRWEHGSFGGGQWGKERTRGKIRRERRK